jgi:hypothetical protein
MHAFHRLGLALGILAAALCSGVRAAGDGAASPPPMQLTRLQEQAEEFWAAPDDARPRLFSSYRHVSLASASNEEVFRYMGRGTRETDFSFGPAATMRTPPGLWDMPPRQAALTLADANRTAAHRKRYALAPDAPEGCVPPEAGSLHVSYSGKIDFALSIGRSYTVRCDPRGSYFAYSEARSLPGSPYYDLRFCPLSIEEARWILQTVWWLDRLRAAGGDGQTTPDSGRGVGGQKKCTLRIVTPGHEGDILVFGNVLLNRLPQFWQGKPTSETFLSLANHLVVNVLSERLGERWSRFDRHSHGPPFEHWMLREAYEDNQLKGLEEAAGKILDLCDLQEGGVSLDVARTAVEGTGYLVLEDKVPRLMALRTALPPPAMAEQVEQARAELGRARAERQSEKLGPPGGWADEPAASYDAAALVVAVHEFREALDLSLRMLGNADDPNELARWADGSGSSAGWAKLRLREQYPTRYVAFMERRFHAGEASLMGIYEVAPETARALAAEVPPGAGGYLEPAAFEVLSKTGTVPDEGKRVAALVRLAGDAAADAYLRAAAVIVLVPVEEPLRHRAPGLDQVLTQIVKEPPQAGYRVMLTEQACRALAVRGQLEQFDTVRAIPERLQGASGTGTVLSSLAYMAQQGGPQHQKALSDLMRPYFDGRKGGLDDLALIAWAADLRELRPELEGVANSGPEDVEDTSQRTWRQSEGAPLGRCHMPRQVLALWDEEDALTRTKLLVAFGFEHALEVTSGYSPELGGRMRTDLARVAGALADRERDQLADFLKWCEAAHPAGGADPYVRDRQLEFYALVRSALGLPGVEDVR